MHQDLVVPREGIHEAEHLMTGRGVDQQIYGGNGVAVFGASSVQVRVIDTELPFAIVFADEDHVRQPSRVVHIFDELSLEELVNFCSYKSVALWMENALLLAVGSKMGFDAKAMGYEGGVDAWHVRMSPGEYISVLG